MLWENNENIVIYICNAIQDRLAVIQKLDKTIYKFIWKNKCPGIFKDDMRRRILSIDLPCLVLKLTSKLL